MNADFKKILHKEKATLYEIERHCNNYFNPANNPNSKRRNYPDAFLKLVVEIVKFKKDILPERKHLLSATNDDYHESIKYNSWQSAFAAELAIYKRIKSI